MTLKNALGFATAAVLLLATPLLAEKAQVPPNPGDSGGAERSASGSGAVPVDETILATLKSAKPMPVPTAPEGAATPLRAGSQRYQAKDFATVTKTLGGETVTTPPSEAIEKAIQDTSALTAPAPGDKAAFEGATETAPVSPPGSQAEKKVFGRDDRVRIRGTNAYPYRVIGLLQMKFPGDGDRRFLCSGTLIGPRKVLTAAHCLYDIERGLWPEEVLFFPGLNGNDAPFGYYPADRVECSLAT